MNNTCKMDDALALCNSLIKWLQSLEIQGPQQNAIEISDGVAVANALSQICPEYFNQTWLSKIKIDVGTNWRLKVSNLKKIVEKVIEYYQDELNLNVLDIAKPDVSKIGESANSMELGKLLQLVLGCAVNSEKKQEYYITRIMAMEESVQQSIMQAIQSLDEATRGRGPFSLPELADPTRIQRLNSDLEDANEARENLAQRCHELEIQVQALTEEKLLLQNERDQIQRTAELRSADLRRQIDHVKEDLYKVETARDDYCIKVSEYEKQITSLQSRIDELQYAAEKAVQLKDEVDALTETAEKVHAMELQLASYKKKLEEYADLKKQMKILEDKNSEYYQQNMNYEEEVKKSIVYKSQIDIYKKQLIELNKKLDDEIQKVDKAEFENKKLETKLLAFQRERDTLLAERDLLKETNEELRCGTRIPLDNSVGDVARELAAPELRERVAFLEKENRSLRSATNTMNTDSAATTALLEEWNQRQEELRVQLRAKNQKVLELQAKLDEVNSNGDTNALKQKCASLQEALNNKEIELQTINDRHKKSLEKAREIINSMQPRVSNEDVVLARNNERNNIQPQNGVMKDAEARLLTTAFLNLGETCQREAVDARLALLSAGQGHTFLSRQRQPTPRRPYNRLK
ncbi:protein hook [Chrysoperla carnea]|uniref:protein hook n=1 Tax=Chrysoperla carnea TaxID=189513 RepID=UPI001D06E1EB|nr:protein hook [Chrysoperla carnea]